MQLQGRNAIITGASQGYGRAVAQAYIKAGANVYLCARNEPMLNDTIRELQAVAPAGQRVVGQPCDVSDPASVQALIDAALLAFGGVDILVNNAGVSGPKGELDEVDWLEWARAIEINLYGTVLPTRALLPHFRARGYGKIINLSGGGATKPMPRVSAYAASKAAVVRFTENIAEELKGTGIDVNAVAPGAMNTHMIDDLISAGPDKLGADYYASLLKQKTNGGVSLDKSAELCVFLASAQSDGITGRLISAVWDPWRTLPDHRDDLARGDVYTLRRIIPQDRGLEWGDPK